MKYASEIYSLLQETAHETLKDMSKKHVLLINVLNEVKDKKINERF